MMRAIRAVSVERGRDPRDFALLAFGGNGGLFAAAIAAELGHRAGDRAAAARRVQRLRAAGGGDGASCLPQPARAGAGGDGAADAGAIGAALAALEAEGLARLADDGFAPARCVLRRFALVRYVGQSSEIAVALPAGGASDWLAALGALFGAEHERTYGFRAGAEEPVELMGLSVIARGLPEAPRLPGAIPPAAADVPAMRRAWFPGAGWVETRVVDRAGLACGALRGPLIVQEYDATCLVPAGVEASVDRFGAIRLGLGGGG